MTKRLDTYTWAFRVAHDLIPPPPRKPRKAYPWLLIVAIAGGGTAVAIAAWVIRAIIAH